MKIFKSQAELQQLGPDSPSLDFIEHYLTQIISAFAEEGRDYQPDVDGYLVLVSEDDAERVLDELDLPYHLIDIPWESVSLERGHFYGLYMANDQFGLGFVIPDSEWLPKSVRQALIENLDP